MLVQPWELQTLGALVLRRGEQRIAHFPTEKVGLVLAYLAVYPSTVHTREALTDCFWPESKPEAGRISLRQAFSSLRRLLEPPDVPSGTVLIADRTQVRLNSDAVHTDLSLWNRLRNLAGETNGLPERILRLEEAIASYGGSFLPGVYVDWVLEERQRQQDKFLEALLALTDLHAESGDVDAAIHCARRMLQTDPLYEEGHERLMRLFASHGRLDLARRQFRTLCHMLHDELGIEPDPKVRELYARLDQIASTQERTPSPRIFVGVPDNPSPDARAPRESEERPRLPVWITRFFGRDDEIRQIGEGLDDPETRLITLTGMGGVGKTRLALEAATGAARFGNAVTFVPLSETTESDLLLPTILQTLGVPAVSYSDPVERLVTIFCGKPHLLILDNFEQIVDAGANLVLQMLEQVPNAVCLVTSRQALRIPGEREFPLSPLPPPASRSLPQELITNPTVQLLIDRMRARRPDFQVTPTNAEAVASLCARLEGIPLAIELAAGWARDLTISQMLDRLAHRFDLLVSRQRGVPQRHQSLRVTVESSYHSLSPFERGFLARLSVFRGGWYADMAAIACDPSEETTDTALTERLLLLREHSLITVRETGEQMRYGMLETLRVFGLEMLTAEETQQLAARHANWFLELARKTSQRLHGVDQAFWLDRLEEEMDNLRSALAYCAVHDSLLGLQLANELYWFWYVRGYFPEGEQWLTLFLEHAKGAPATERAWGLLAAGHFANCQSNNVPAVARYQEARALFEECGDDRGVAHALGRLGNAAQEMLDAKTGNRLCAESVSRFRNLNDPNGLLLALFYYANTLFDLERPDKGQVVFTEALELAQSLGDIRFESILLHCLSQQHRETGNIEASYRGYRSALELQRRLREPLPVSYMLRELAYLANHRGDSVLAARLFGAMQGLRQRMGYPVGLHEQVTLTNLESHLRSTLEDDDYVRSFETGRSLDFDACLLLAWEAAQRG